MVRPQIVSTPKSSARSKQDSKDRANGTVYFIRRDLELTSLMGNANDFAIVT